MIETVKETLTLSGNIGEGVTQALLEGDFIVPDVKPDIAAILRTDAEIFAEKKDVANDRLNFGVTLKLSALYLAKGGDKPVHSLTVTASADDFLNVEGLTRDMWVDVSAKIVNVDYKMLNDRKINYRAVVEVSCHPESASRLEYVSHIVGLPESRMRKTAFTVNKAVENRADRFVIKDDLTIAAGKPGIRDLLQTTVAIANKEVKVGNGRVHVSGDLSVCALYRGDGDSVIEFSEHEVTFNGAIDMPSVKEGMFGDVELSIAGHNERVTSDSDGEDRVINLEATITAAAKVTSQSEITAVSDAYSVGKRTTVSTVTAEFPQSVCRNKNQTTVKETVTLDAAAPDVMQVFRVTGAPRLTDVKATDDKVIAEGVIEADVLYIAESDDVPLYNHKCALPFRQIIETKGCTPDMTAKIDLSVDHTGFNMLSNREIEARFLVTFNTKVTRNKRHTVVGEVTFEDIDKEEAENAPSMTVYIAQPGDALWDVAKKFNAETEELTELNDIEEGRIKPGDKLLVLKKAIA